MSFGRIQQDKADKLYSLFRREKDGKCWICGKREGLQVHHWYGRRHEATRFMDDNCDVVCFTHHRFAEESSAEYSKLKLSQLGQKRYDMVGIKAMGYFKKDRKLAYIIVNMRYSEWKGYETSR